MDVKLYRAAQSTDINSDTTSFARRASDARAYLDNPGFGGAQVYRAALSIDDACILDIRDEVPGWLQEIIDGMGAVTQDYAITRGTSDMMEALRAHGVRWVILTDTYPDDCETWVHIAWAGDWYGDDVVSAAMVAI